MFGDDSKLRLRKSHGATAATALDCEEGGSNHNRSGSNHNPNASTAHHHGHGHHHSHHHHHHHTTAGMTTVASGLSLPSLQEPPPPSYGQVRGIMKRRRRRKVLAKYCRVAVSGLVATIVSVTLSLMLLPFSWVQVDYHHQVQHEFEYIYQVLEDNRRNYNSLMRGIHHHERQIKCADGSSIGFENDNYCDCVGDGSDERSTSACSHVTVGHRVFQCQNDRDTWIFASRVGDGIMDCPDGSDEK